MTGVFRLLFTKPVFAPYFNFELFIDIFACPLQYLLNFFLFVPMGFLVPLLWKQYRAEKYVLLFGFGTSFAIEVLQMFCGRTSDVDDLLMNTLGALIGYWMFLAAEPADFLLSAAAKQNSGSRRGSIPRFPYTGL